MAHTITREDFLLTQYVQSVLELMQMERDMEELRSVRWTGWEARILEVKELGGRDERLKRND